MNTKADIRFDVLGADFLPDWVKENLMQQARGSVRASACWRASALADAARRAAGEEPHEQ